MEQNPCLCEVLVKNINGKYMQKLTVHTFENVLAVCMLLIAPMRSAAPSCHKKHTKMIVLEVSVLSDYHVMIIIHVNLVLYPLTVNSKF